MAADAKFSVHLSYDDYFAEANQASKKVGEMMSKNIFHHAKQVSVFGGAGAAKSTAASGLLGSIVTPIVAPFLMTGMVSKTIIKMMGQTAIQSAKQFNREFKAASMLRNTIFDPVAKKMAPFTGAAGMGVVGAIQQVKKRGEETKKALDVATEKYKEAQSRYNKAVKQSEQETIETAKSVAAKHQAIVNKHGGALKTAMQPANRAKLFKKELADVLSAKKELDKHRSVDEKNLLKKVAAPAASLSKAQKEIDDINRLREEIKERKVLVGLSKASLKQFDKNAKTSSLSDLSRRKELVRDVRSENQKLILSEAKLQAMTGGAVGGRLTALRSVVLRSKKELAAIRSGGESGETKAAQQRLAAAKVALQAAAAQERVERTGKIQFARNSLAHAIREGRSAVSAAKRNPSESNLKRVQAAAESESSAKSSLEEARKAAGVDSKFGMVKRTISSVVQVVSGALGSAFRILGGIVTSVFTIIVTAIRGAIAILTSLAKLAFATGMMVAAGFAIGLKHVITFGKELRSLSRETGIAEKSILLMQHALYRSDASAAAVAATMVHLRDTLRFPDMNAAIFLKQVGLSFESLRKLSPEQQFAKLATAINNVADPLLRNAMLVQFFGEEGAKAAAKFRPGDLEDAAKKYGMSTEQFAKASAQLEAASDAWQRVKTAGSEFFKSMAISIAPALEAGAKFFETKLIPLAQKWGAIIGQKLKAALEVFVGLWNMVETGAISFGELLKLSFTMAAMWFGNLMVQVIKFTGKLLWGTLVESFKVLGDPNFLMGLFMGFAALGQLLIDSAMAFDELLLSPSLYAGLVKMWLGVQFKFVSALLKGVQSVVEYLAAGIVWAAQKINPFGKDKTFDEVLREQEKVNLFGGVTNALDESSANLMVDAIADLKAAFASVSTNPTERAKHTAMDALAEFKKIDPSGFVELAKKIPQLWSESASDLFSDPAVAGQFMKLLEEARVRGGGIIGGGAQGAANDGKDNMASPFVMPEFDSLRKIGASLPKGSIWNGTGKPVEQAAAQAQPDGYYADAGKGDGSKQWVSHSGANAPEGVAGGKPMTAIEQMMMKRQGFAGEISNPMGRGFMGSLSAPGTSGFSGAASRAGSTGFAGAPGRGNMMQSFQNMGGVTQASVNDIPKDQLTEMKSMNQKLLQIHEVLKPTKGNTKDSKLIPAGA